MKYQTEHITDLANSQELMRQLFLFIGENEEQTKQLRPSWQPFMQAWAGENPLVRIKVFTARDEQNAIQGCVMAILTADPLFISKPSVARIVNITQGDKGFEDYVNIVLASL